MLLVPTLFIYNCNYVSSDLLIVFSSPFLTAPFGNGHIDHLTDLLNDLIILIDITIIDKVIKLAKNLNFCAN